MENVNQYQEDSEAKYDCLFHNELRFARSCKLDCPVQVIYNLFSLLSDLDDTLYPLSSGLSLHVTKNIQGMIISFWDLSK